MLIGNDRGVLTLPNSSFLSGMGGGGEVSGRFCLATVTRRFGSLVEAGARRFFAYNRIQRCYKFDGQKIYCGEIYWTAYQVGIGSFS